MHRFWKTVIEPALEHLRPEVIVEIGSDRGDNTRNLLEFCERNSGTLHVIDPLPKYDVSEWREKYGEKFVFHKSLSLDALLEVERPDAVLIDGDHNWYTVFHELEMIEKLAGDHGFPLVMLHDVGWPYGRRDLYYDPATIPEEHRNSFARKGMSPGSAGLVEKGGLNSHLAHAVREGGPRNGVLTAVEDFMEQSEEDFEFRWVPGLHGLGTIAPRRLEERNEGLAGFLDSLDSLTTSPSAGHIEQVELARLQTQTALQERAKRSRALRREAREAREENAELRRKLKQGRHNVQRLTGWLETLEVGVNGVLGSRRWKIGSLLADLSQRKPPGREEPEGVGSMRRALEEFRVWKQKRASRSAGKRKPSKKAKAGQGASGGAAPGRLGPDQKGGIKRVQVGCGPHNVMQDWWNTDIRRLAGIDAALDATQPWPYEDLEYVYGEHFLEHLTLDGAVAFLKHAGNSLRAGGKLRLSTPNLEWVLRTHYPYEKAEIDEIVSGVLQTNRAFHGWGHQFLYSEGMLKYLLGEMGFEGISFFTYGESEEPALRNIERHGKFSIYEGHPSVVIVEATKGERPIEPSPEMSERFQNNYLNVVRPGAR